MSVSFWNGSRELERVLMYESKAERKSQAEWISPEIHKSAAAGPL